MEQKYNELLNYSNPRIVLKNARKIFGPNTMITVSSRKNKKYQIYNPNTNKWVHFGQMEYEDYTFHKDDNRRNNYLLRSSNIKGNWKDDPYSPNNLSRSILW